MKRLLDASLEWLILLARALSVAGLLGVVAVGLVATTPGVPVTRLLVVLAQLVLWTGVFGWFGWWFYGNEEWRRREDPE